MRLSREKFRLGKTGIILRKISARKFILKEQLLHLFLNYDEDMHYSVIVAKHFPTQYISKDIGGVLKIIIPQTLT